MKYIIGLVFVAAILVSSTVQSQHLNFGIKGGANFYNVNTNNTPGNFDIKPGIHLGLLWHIHVADHFAIQPELVYSQQGTRYNFGSDENRIKLDYINVPVLFQYMFDNGFRFQGGPQLGFLVNAKSELNSNNTDVKDSYEKNDVSLVVGMSYVKPSTGFGVDSRYVRGLTEINKNGLSESKNNGFQVGVFYLFGHH
jgi:hypothetical protein